MSALEIRLLGTFQIGHQGRVQVPRPIHAVQALLAYLVLHRQKTHAREVLAGLFWGDYTETKARSCLSTALWRLRQVLEPHGIARGAYLLTRSSGEVGFNSTSDHWLDVAALEEGLQPLVRSRPALHPSFDWAGAEKAMTHYSGDLLEGFYEDWALRERERLRLLYLDGLSRLLDHYSEIDALEQALACGWRILELDALREEIHRAIMRLHLRAGHRSLALQQFESCREILKHELGVAPMPETQALYSEIRPEGKAAHWRRTSSTRERVLPPLHAAAQSLDQAREQLNRVIRLVESESESETEPPSL
jgi:DNA-binding SARP family transcriptional activator